jgi:hypothetical protein
VLSGSCCAYSATYLFCLKKARTKRLKFVCKKSADPAPILLVMMLLLLLLMRSGLALQYTTYSCDTTNATDGMAFFDAASIPILNGKHCPYAPPSADPLGPCFRSPSDVKAELDMVPVGKRAISLEGTSMYYVQDANKTRYFQDKLECGYASPFMDIWADALNHRFTTWFANFSAIGGKLDIVLSDFELGGHAYWYSFALQHGNCSAGPKPQESLQKDSRWPALLERLNDEGQKYNASFDDLDDMQTWEGFSRPFNDWRPWVWDIVVVDHIVAEHLNNSVYEPIRAQFPNVHFSNFAHHYHSDASAGHRSSGRSEQAGRESRESSSKAGAGTNGGRRVGDPSGEWWPFAAASGCGSAGTGSHVGTHQSKSFYGGSPWHNSSRILKSQSATDEREVTGSAFNALVQGAKVGRPE